MPKFKKEGGELPRTKKQTTGKTPANEQKGEKECSFCHNKKKLTDFYISKSPLFSVDERVPVCKDCVINESLNEDGTINELELNKILKKIDRPYYKDLIESALVGFKNEHSYVEDDDAIYYGKEILQRYFRLIAMRQDRDKSYEDSEKDGFIHPTSNTPKSTKERIAQKYADITENKTEQNIKQNSDVKWTKEDKQNMKYIISKLGYDPFEDVGLDEFDRKYCFNLLSGYFDTPGILEDGHKKQCVIEITMSYCQCRKITDELNTELAKPDSNEKRITSLTNAKSSLLSSIATIAKDNNISSNYNKNSNQGQDSISSMMKEMEKNGFQEIQVNIFDVKTSEAFKQIDNISNENIANQLTLDNSEYSDIVKEQREMIKNFETEIDRLKEENRNYQNKIIDLEGRKR